MSGLVLLLTELRTPAAVRRSQTLKQRAAKNSRRSCDRRLCSTPMRSSRKIRICAHAQRTTAAASQSGVKCVDMVGHRHCDIGHEASRPGFCLQRRLHRLFGSKQTIELRGPSTASAISKRRSVQGPRVGSVKWHGPALPHRDRARSM
jgi:hypothetical protein